MLVLGELHFRIISPRCWPTILVISRLLRFPP